MEIVFTPVGPVRQPMILPPTNPRGSDVTIDDATAVTGHILNRIGQPEKLKSALLTYFSRGDFPKAAILAETMYKQKLATPEELCELLGNHVSLKPGRYVRLDARKGTPEDGRINFGGLLKPGLKTANVSEMGLHAVNEAFIPLTSQSGPDSDIGKIFSQYKPAPSVAHTPISPTILNLGSHRGCCPDGSH